MTQLKIHVSLGSNVSAAGPRSRRTSSRRRRSPLVAETAMEAEANAQGSGEDEEPEKIEVHVHVHRGGEAPAAKRPARKKRKPRGLALTGTLFDWKEHYDQVCRPPSPTPAAPGAARMLNCSSCGAEVPRFARTCRRCEAPQPRRFFTRVAVALGFASVIGVFALCSVVLGESTREQRTPEPLRSDFTIDEAYVIEVSPSPSPFRSDFSATGLTPGGTLRTSGD